MKSAVSFRQRHDSASQFPENVRRDLLESLRTRRVNHKFHYDSVKQTQKWLALHQAYSPTRNDADCRRFMRKASRRRRRKSSRSKFTSSASAAAAGKRTRGLLKLLKATAGRFFTRRVMSAPPWFWSRAKPRWLFCRSKIVFHSFAIWRRRMICTAVFDSRFTRHASRLVTFFGMIPNFEPQEILPRLASLVQPEGFSAVQRQSCSRRPIMPPA